MNTFADENDVMQSLILAQEDIKKEILKDCYSVLCEAIDAAPAVPLTPDMMALQDAIKIPLAWKTFEWWLVWYSNVTFSDSASQTVTDRTGSAFSNIDAKEKEKLIAQAKSRYDMFKDDAITAIKEIGLDCYKDECQPKCCNAPVIDDSLSHLPDVV